MYKVKLQYQNESWEDTGRTIYISKGDAPTILTARSMVREIIGKDWKVFSIEVVTQ